MALPHLSQRRPGQSWAALLAVALLASCAGPVAAPANERLQVVATTPVLADLAANVAGDRAEVTSLVPAGADPHTYEPSLRDVRKVVYADVAFSNYLLLEPHSVISMLDANVRPGVPNIALAEGATKYAAEVSPLVENVKLDTIWLGMRVRGTGTDKGATRASTVELTVTGVDGPGDIAAYLTGSFGQPDIKANSADGFDARDGYAHDTAVLPTDAHTHMSWAFTKPGIYKMHVRSRLLVDASSRPQKIADGTVTFAVGVDPHNVDGMPGAHVLDHGHADLTADLDQGAVYLFADEKGGGSHSQREFALDSTVVAVPNLALSEIPPTPAFRFLGRPGEQVYQLPQAVLGAHVHGEIDPHLWHNVRNAKAYVELIRDTLIDADPAGRQTYASNARAYLAQLDEVDEYVASRIEALPVSRRNLITTHDAYGYLAQRYGIRIAGFVTPNPAIEPSMAERRRLDETIRNLSVPAVFLEPTLARESAVLATAADAAGVQICPIYGDTFDSHVTSYVQLMRFNADSLSRCLGRD